MTHQIGPCEPYATEDDLCSPCDDYSVDPTRMADSLDMASFILFFATGQQFYGECEVTVQPCSCHSFPVEDWTVSRGVLTISDTFSVFSACGCSRRASCSCTHLSAIELPLIPATEVSSVVTTDDGTLSPSDYELRGQELVRLDDLNWPLCDEDFRVTYTYGIPAPSILRRATAILACELYMGCNPEEFKGKCRLPRNVVSITRQGLSVLMESAFWSSPRAGRPVSFGIPEIDIAIATLNPNGLTAPCAIVSPDDPDLARLVP